MRLTLGALLLLAACGHTFTATKSVAVDVNPPAGAVTVRADGDVTCVTKGPPPFLMTTVCDPGEVPWYVSTGPARAVGTCAPLSCAPGTHPVYHPNLTVTCDADR